MGHCKEFGSTLILMEIHCRILNKGAAFLFYFLISLFLIRLPLENQLLGGKAKNGSRKISTEATEVAQMRSDSDSIGMMAISRCDRIGSEI